MPPGLSYVNPTIVWTCRALFTRPTSRELQARRAVVTCSQPSSLVKARLMPAWPSYFSSHLAWSSIRMENVPSPRGSAFDRNSVTVRYHDFRPSPSPLRKTTMVPEASSFSMSSFFKSSVGQFDQAVKYQQLALSLIVGKPEIEAFRGRLELYTRKTPYREALRRPAAPPPRAVEP